MISFSFSLLRINIPKQSPNRYFAICSALESNIARFPRAYKHSTITSLLNRICENSRKIRTRCSMTDISPSYLRALNIFISILLFVSIRNKVIEKTKRSPLLWIQGLNIDGLYYRRHTRLSYSALYIP